MGLITLINSDNSLLETIRESYKKMGRKLGYTIQMISSEEKIQESINYDLPELVLINCADKNISLDTIIEKVHTDSWLHSFGIIGLFDGSKQDEQEISEKLRDLNLLVLLDYNRINSHLMKCINIILENWQLIFQREVSSHFIDRNSGSFLIENDTLSVPIYAGMPATSLVQMGLIDAGEKMKLHLALSELIINSIEHGNCGITYEEKSEALGRGLSVVELIQERCEDPAISAKRVLFAWESSDDKTVFTIRDEGEGFDVSAIRKKTAEQDIFSFHGRGIAMAESMVGNISYNDKGNEVTLVIEHNKNTTKDTPQGFSDAETIYPKKGDKVFEEGERGDFLYYIAAGQFSVYHNGKVVGSLSPADIFMGEMSFLLNNRRSATVISDGDAKLIKISRKAFVEVTRQYPHYGIFLSKLLARKLARSNRER
ncbi:MAG: cyclic nucleotide-binding protein, partial [Spirochaetaceae bacterium]